MPDNYSWCSTIIILYHNTKYVIYHNTKYVIIIILSTWYVIYHNTKYVIYDNTINKYVVSYHRERGQQGSDGVISHPHPPIEVSWCLLLFCLFQTKSIIHDVCCLPFPTKVSWCLFACLITTRFATKLSGYLLFAFFDKCGHIHFYHSSRTRSLAYIIIRRAIISKTNLK